MSLFLTLPISGQGTITDVDTARALPSVMGDPFGFTDVFLYSHGWWTSAESAMIDYNAFSVGVCADRPWLGERCGSSQGDVAGDRPALAGDRE